MSSSSSHRSDVSFSPSVNQGFQTNTAVQAPTPRRKTKSVHPTFNFSTPPSAQPQRNIVDDSTSGSGISSSGKSGGRCGSDSASDNGSHDSSDEKAESSHHNDSERSVRGLFEKFEDDLGNVAEAEVELWERSTPHHQKLANNMVTPQKLKAKMQLIRAARRKPDGFDGHAPIPRSTKMPVRTEDPDDYDGYESNAGYRLAIGPSYFEQIRHYVAEHPFTISCVLQESYAIESRRFYFYELYNYARSLGCSSRQAKQASIYARARCGEDRYDSDNTSLGGHRSSDNSTPVRGVGRPSTQGGKMDTSGSDSDGDSFTSSGSSSSTRSSVVNPPTKGKRSNSIDSESKLSSTSYPTPKPAARPAVVGRKEETATANKQPTQNTSITKRNRTRSRRLEIPDQPPLRNMAPAAHSLENVFSVSDGNPGTTFPDRPDPASESATVALDAAKVNKRQFGAMDPKPRIHAEPSIEKKPKRRKVHGDMGSKDQVEQMIDGGVSPAVALTAALPSNRVLANKGDEIMEALEKDKDELEERYGDLVKTTGGRAIAVKKRNEKRKAEGYHTPEILKPSRSPTPIYVNEREKQNALRRSGDKARKGDDGFEKTLRKQDQLNRAQRERELNVLTRNEKASKRKKREADNRTKTLVKADAPVPKLYPPTVGVEPEENDSDAVKRNRLDRWRKDVAEGTIRAPASSSSTAKGVRQGKKQKRKKADMKDAGEQRLATGQVFDCTSFANDGIAILIPPSPGNTFKGRIDAPFTTKQAEAALASPASDPSSAPTPPRTPSPLPILSCSDSDYERMQHLSRRRTILQTKGLIPSITRAKSMDIQSGPIPFVHRVTATTSHKGVPLSQSHKALKSILKNSPYFPNSPQVSVTPRQKVSAVPFPSTESVSFGLAQEKLCRDPFRLLIAVMFLNKTKGSVAIPVFYELMEMYPTPTDLAAAEHQDIVEVIRHLGLQNQRAKKCIAFAQEWLENPPVKGKRYRRLHYPNKGDGKDISVMESPIDDDDERIAYEVSHLPGIGDYAIDSWRIFCRDELRGLPTGLPSVFDAKTKREELRKEWATVLPRDKELRAYLRWRWLRLGYEWDPLTGKKKTADWGLRHKSKSGGFIHEHDGGGTVEPGVRGG